MSDDFQQCLLEKHEFERMQDMAPENVAAWATYDAFVEWNKQCFAATVMPVALIGICALVRKGAMKMVDMESCGEWTACSFYFNAKKQIVIVHPR
jgi:hypothetical protein